VKSKQMKTPHPQTSLIIGAGSGMGRATALLLAARGMEIFCADLNLDSAGETAQAVALAGGRAEAFHVDISRSESVNALFDELRRKARSLGLLVNTAAILGPTAFVEDITDDIWRRIMSVNLDGAFYCCREAVRWMKETGGGRILLFSSVASLTPTPGAAAYSAAKGAVNMFARTLAAEVAKHNIRVNVIAPGYIRTPMLEGLPEGFDEYVSAKLTK
jgi:NAD(P)-dependent dehydrogenase (short-subunit alcohol dehydrogenase family)